MGEPGAAGAKARHLLATHTMISYPPKTEEFQNSRGIFDVRGIWKIPLFF